MSPKLLLLSALPWTVSGHGYMVTPTIRNIQNPPFKYEPQSLGAFGPGQEILVCGKGAHSHQESDKFGALPAPGSQFKFQAKITAHHMGHMIVRVCPFITAATTAADLSNCIRLSGEGGETWPLSAETGMKEWVATLPSKAELDSLNQNNPKGVFTIQWRYNTANSCAASDQLGNSNCGETNCCSEVFTNCADVVFDGVASEPDSVPEAPQPTDPQPSPPPPPSGGGGGATGQCVSMGVWKSENMDAWCASNGQCGGDSHGGRCDCSCGAGSNPQPSPAPEAEPEPEVGHTIAPSAAAMKHFKGLEQFCALNKEYYCDTQNTQDMAAGLCDCTPTASTEPADPEPEPEAEPEADSAATGTLSKEECRQECQDTCNALTGGVATNQYWGEPPYVQCKCAADGNHPDGVVKEIPGCECKHSTCPKSLVATKFAGGVRQRVEIQAHGDLDMN